MGSLPPAAVPVVVVALLAALLALLESTLPALRPVPAQPGAGLRARMAGNPAGLRHAAQGLRLLLLGGMGVAIALSPPAARVTTAVTALLLIAALFLLSRGGLFLRISARAAPLAGFAAAMLAPLFLALRAAGRAAGPAGPAIEDLADAIATEPLECQRMVRAMLELENRSVEDVMVPRSEVLALDLESDWEQVLELLRNSPHTRLPVCEGDLDRVVGIAHMKRIANELAAGRLDHDRLREVAGQRLPVFALEGTSLHAQLVRFRRLRRRIAFVIDEYGSVQGIITLEDILEEIVGEFTTQPTLLHRDWDVQSDGSYLVAGSATLRAVNRALGWSLPTDGPRTLSGLITEYLESIPDPGTCLKLGDYAIEVLQVAGNAVRTARVWPPGAPAASG